ncbi:MAG: peptidylprolyl isomerase [Anaerolineaceae bacterium 4572_5.2]|nr:MAG: peptidylprolyl isomerase [Anaerolineaceae bacterium 4572_5.2]
MTTDSGLQYAIVEAGDGDFPQPGDIARVHYTGKLSDGEVFDSSYDREKPIQFVVGMGQVIPGWDEAVQLLKAGAKAKLIIPSELAYGEAGVGEDIPPNSTLYFEVELLEVRPGENEPPTEVAESDYIITESGLKYYDIKMGDGDSPRRGEMPLVHYVGWLEDGAKFDSSRDRGTPLHFTLGVEQVIPGFEEGILSMNVGSKRQLVISPELAFGEEGAGSLIPPNATLIYEVELIAISDYHP